MVRIIKSEDDNIQDLLIPDVTKLGNALSYIYDDFQRSTISTSNIDINYERETAFGGSISAIANEFARLDCGDTGKGECILYERDLAINFRHRNATQRPKLFKLSFIFSITNTVNANFAVGLSSERDGQETYTAGDVFAGVVKSDTTGNDFRLVVDDGVGADYWTVRNQGLLSNTYHVTIEMLSTSQIQVDLKDNNNVLIRRGISTRAILAPNHFYHLNFGVQAKSLTPRVVMDIDYWSMYWGLF